MSIDEKLPPRPPVTFTKQLVDPAQSPRRTLMTHDQITRHVELLREHLARDRTEQARLALRTKKVREGLTAEWWQRIPFRRTSVTTKSDWARADLSDPGWLNTLGGALRTDEGALLRPMPKWAYLEPLMPDLAGKTVLEIGCNNGFFSFAFQELGAKHVTGIDVAEQYVERARWMADYRRVTNIDFRIGDPLLDLTIPKHDVVFMSEVHGHFIDPLYGVLRAINLANETLILDGAADPAAGLGLDLGAGVDPATGRLTYHAWLMSDGLMLSYLYLCGVEPQRVTRYVAPWPNHIAYVIDTTGVAEFRRVNDFHPANTSFINMAFRTGRLRRPANRHAAGVSRIRVPR